MDQKFFKRGIFNLVFLVRIFEIFEGLYLVFFVCDYWFVFYNFDFIFKGLVGLETLGVRKGRKIIVLVIQNYQLYLLSVEFSF